MSYLDFAKQMNMVIDAVGLTTPIMAPIPLQPTPEGQIEAALDAEKAAALKENANKDDMTDNGTLIYPQNLFQPGNEAYIFFIMRDSNKQDAAPLKRIGLYMPPSIKVKYHTTWEPLSMSVEQASNVLSDAYNSLTSPLGSESSNTGMSSMASAALRGSAATIDSFIGGGSFGQQSEVAMGRTVDPAMALMFKGVDFRQFQFEFQFLARTKEESDSIRKIIKTFKWGMHPGKQTGKSWWEYPNNFDIYLLTPSHRYMFNISQCVLEDIDVDYGGSGAASFFKKTGAPVDIRMTLQFKEMELLTKERIEADY